MVDDPAFLHDRNAVLYITAGVQHVQTADWLDGSVVFMPDTMQLPANTVVIRIPAGTPIWSGDGIVEPLSGVYLCLTRFRYNGYFGLVRIPIHEI